MNLSNISRYQITTTVGKASFHRFTDIFNLVVFCFGFVWRQNWVQIQVSYWQWWHQSNHQDSALLKKRPLELHNIHSMGKFGSAINCSSKRRLPIIPESAGCATRWTKRYRGTVANRRHECQTSGGQRVYEARRGKAQPGRRRKDVCKKIRKSISQEKLGCCFCWVQMATSPLAWWWNKANQHGCRRRTGFNKNFDAIDEQGFPDLAIAGKAAPKTPIGPAWGAGAPKNPAPRPKEQPVKMERVVQEPPVKVERAVQEPPTPKAEETWAAAPAAKRRAPLIFDWYTQCCDYK